MTTEGGKIARVHEDHWGRRVVWALLGLVLLYGALLRFDALTLTHGVVERPAWLAALQQTRQADSVLRPDAFRWQPREGRYISDPHTYLLYAREIRSPWQAHHREPLFPLAVKAALHLLDDQDVAVSVASAAFSGLAILATYLLGALAFSRWIGLGAAAALAIEYDAITWGIGGWRDEAFTCAVVFSAWALLRFHRHPSARSALLLGLVAGLACLVRITSLSFLVPGLLLVAAFGWRDRRGRSRHLAVALLVATAVAGPYLINCWRTFGDPLHAINVHADVYRATRGDTIERPQTAAEFLAFTGRARPMLTIETFVLGMTTYPFQNKWDGFRRWSPVLAPALSSMALAGLFLWLGSPAGRLLFVILASSLVPYAMTWRLISDWRFTQHAYPFFLIAAFVALGLLLRLPQRVTRHDLRRRPLSWRPAASWAAAGATVIAASLLVFWLLPVRVAKEALRAGEPVSIGGTSRDRVYFTRGWSRPRTLGNVRARVSTRPDAVVRVPLPGPDDYRLTFRIDPYPPPDDTASAQPTVTIFSNGRPLSTFALLWNPERVGAYDVHLPAAMTRRGLNRLTVKARQGGSEEPARVRLWHVRVHPPIAAPVGH